MKLAPWKLVRNFPSMAGWNQLTTRWNLWKLICYWKWGI